MLGYLILFDYMARQHMQSRGRWVNLRQKAVVLLRHVRIYKRHQNRACKWKRSPFYVSKQARTYGIENEEARIMAGA